MENLTKLKQLTSNLSILYIESDLELQKKVSLQLGRFFSKVYQAYDGADGLSEYKKLKPDIILTDLQLSKLNSFSMITEIKELNSDASIIVLSYRNDTFDLLEMFDCNLVALLEKPLNLISLQHSIQKAILDKLKNEKCSTCEGIILNTLKSKEPINCINNYKGVVLNHKGEILYYKENQIAIKVTKAQLLSVVHEKHMIIHVNKNYMLAKLLEVNKSSNVAILSNPKIINFHKRSITNKRINVDGVFKVSITYKNTHTELTAIDLSYKYISVLNTKKLKFNKHDKIEITMGFEIDGPSRFDDKKFTKIFASGTIVRIDTLYDKENILIELAIKKSGQRVFQKYLQTRELDIIKEFKAKMKI